MEPRKCPLGALTAIKSIGEIVYELKSPPRWSKLMVVLYTWSLYSPHGPKGAPVSNGVERWFRDM